MYDDENSPELLEANQREVDYFKRWGMDDLISDHLSNQRKTQKS